MKEASEERAPAVGGLCRPECVLANDQLFFSLFPSRSVCEIL